MATQKQQLDNLIALHGLRTEISRDKYGRAVCHYTKVVRDAEGKFVASYHSPVVKLPKTATEVRPEQQYLVNDWSTQNYSLGATDADRGITYHRTRFEAHQQAIANVVAAEVAAALQSV